MSTMHDSLLYDAATNSLASDVSSDNCWTKMVTAGLTVDDAKFFSKDIKAVEDLIKKEYGLKSMPSPWRSAKSVVLTAMAALIKLTDENGNIKGKSAIQALLKANKDEKDVEIMPKVRAAIGVVLKYIKSGELTPKELEEIEDMLKEAKDLC